MTFILGIKCSDGLVLLSDTRERGGSANQYRQKVHATNVGEEWGVSWGVAGNGHVADRFTDEVRAVLGSDSYNRHAIEQNIESCLKFVRRQYPNPEDAIEIIVGVFGRSDMVASEFLLYRGDSFTACLAPTPKSYCVAGMDVSLAAFILQNAWNPFGFVDEASRFGILLTSLMKTYATDVGGPTEAFLYRVGATTWTPMLDREIKSIEADFPLHDIENHMTEFWLNHPKARQQR